MIINLDCVPEIYLANHSIAKPKINHVDLTVDTTTGYRKKYPYIFQNSVYCTENKVYFVGVIHFYSLFNLLKFEDFVPQHILEKVRNKEILLALDLSAEATHKLVENMYKKCINENVPTTQVLLISSSADLIDSVIKFSNIHQIDPIKYECYYKWEQFTQRNILMEMEMDVGSNDPVTFNLKSPLEREYHSKSFLCLMRSWRQHRGALLILLKHRNLLDKGYVSFQNYSWWDFFHKQVIEEYKNSEIEEILTLGYDIKNLLPLKVDDCNIGIFLHTNHMSRRLNPFYNDSLFSVVVETHFNNRYPFFCTEKVFKAILQKHPFLIVSTPNYLSNLRKLGYKTFDGLINEEYDTIIDPAKRLLKIVAEIERLSNLTPIELQNFKSKALDIVHHNYDILIKKTNFIHKIN